MQLRNRIELEPARQLAAQISGGVLQRFDRIGRMFGAGKMREEHLRVGQVGRDFHRSHSHHADARILDMQPKQIGKLALNLVTHTMGPLSVFFHEIGSFTTAATDRYASSDDTTVAP